MRSELTCEHCGKPIKGRRRHKARFCGGVCRQAAYRRRKAGVAEDQPKLAREGVESTKFTGWKRRRTFYDVKRQEEREADQRDRERRAAEDQKPKAAPKKARTAKKKAPAKRKRR